MTVGRNDPCPCGSGEKYKRCCAEKVSHGTDRTTIGMAVIVGAFAVFGLVALGAALFTSEDDILPGRVWSQKHGHFHDVGSGPKPQPPGPVPPGKVWSAEHGHWHDAAAAKPQPPGPVPPGKVWSEEHGHWHDAVAGTQARPPGPAPPGKVWSEEHGHWHDLQ